MIKCVQIFLVSLLVPLLFYSTLFAQGKPYEGPEDGAGDPAAERVGFMEGNRVRLQFRNTTELSDWGAGTDPFATKWPNDFTGVKMNDGIGLLIGARVFIYDDPATPIDSTPVTDSLEIKRLDQAGQLDTLYYLQTSYREEQDTDPTGQIEWNLYPPRGYFRWESETPALMSKPQSWPPEGWPSRGFEKKWPGEWNGRFGRGVFRADEECYFVANDAQDQEYLTEEDSTTYFPRPGIEIGDYDPEISIQVGLPWGGVGIRVEQRGFQWNNPQAMDAIFWEYSIANISDYDLTQMAFGYWVDNAIGGGDDNDELAAFDKIKDLAYSWDINGLGLGSLPTGTMGFAYLESPGKPYDGRDNDDDGIIDEKRDNLAGALVGPTDGIADVAKFLTFYNLQESDLREHWEGDEDQDWDSYSDDNGNGIYDNGEDANDDVGLDGVGPYELNYIGPDADGTEGNGMPDLLIGVNAEPDFGLTDVTESDMLGLTAFRLFPIPAHNPPYTNWYRNDESMWYLIGVDSLIEYIGSTSNLAEVFASGVFPVYRGQIERISMSELHSFDPLEGLNSATHTSPALFRLKEIVQIIYETDYRFAQPPHMPTLIATPGDGSTLLTWDNIADTKTRDAFLKNVNDFEGYKVYRTADNKFTDATTITDGYGTKSLRKAIFQCDLKDNKSGFADFATFNGVAVYLGDETGITHSFRDINVQNGRTYYYAVVAYDYGAPDIGTGVAPSENNIIIELDESENVVFHSKNVAIVTPRKNAAGYNLTAAYDIEGAENLIGRGTIVPELVAPNALSPDAKYKVKFNVHEISRIRNMDWGVRWVCEGLTVSTDGNLVFEDSDQNMNSISVDSTETLGYRFLQPGGVTTDIFDGLVLHIDVPVITATYDYENSGWLKGSAAMTVTPTIVESNSFPWDYDIIFTDNPAEYTTFISPAVERSVYDENDVRIRTGLLAGVFNFRVVNNSIVDTTSGENKVMDLVVQDMDVDGVYNPLNDRILVGAIDDRGRWAGTVFVLDFFNVATEAELPQAGDVYHVRFAKPFWSTDSLTFSVRVDESLDKSAITKGLENVKVVPNPYVATNEMEPSLANPNLNQRRRLMFTNLPARCEIKIFTISGVLVDEILVENPSDVGLAHWDLLTREGLEVAAGMYIYYIKAKETGDEKMGKFAVIK